MGTPLVTVTLCVRNGERYLREAVDSVLAQSLKDLELIVVDDASTDATAEILRSFQDGRIRILSNQQPLGLTKSLNRAWRAGSGSFIAHLDADDRAFAQRLERQVAHLTEHPDVGLLASDVLVVDPDGGFIQVDRFPRDHERLCAGLVTDCTILHSSMMYRRTLMGELGGYNEDFYYCQDYDLQCRMSRKAKFECLPEVLVAWRRHPQTIGGNRVTEQRAFAKRLALVNIAELTGGEVPGDVAGRFFDALHGDGAPWSGSDAASIDRLVSCLLKSRPWRSVWIPRLLRLVEAKDSIEAEMFLRGLSRHGGLAFRWKGFLLSMRSVLSPDQRTGLKRVLQRMRFGHLANPRRDLPVSGRPEP